MPPEYVINSSTCFLVSDNLSRSLITYTVHLIKKRNRKEKKNGKSTWASQPPILNTPGASTTPAQWDLDSHWPSRSTQRADQIIIMDFKPKPLGLQASRRPRR